MTGVQTCALPISVQSSRSYVISVSHVAATLASPVNYSLSLHLETMKTAADLSLANAALFSLVSLADGVARMSDRNPNVIDAALRAALDELGKSGEFLVLVLDPVTSPVLTDSQGRQSGYLANSGTINETPGGYVSAGAFGQVVIVPVSSSGTFELRFAGTGPNLEQSFSAFVVGPSGSQRVSQGMPQMSTSDGKTNFVVELGFGGLPTRSSSVPGGQAPSFFMMTNLTPNNPQTPSIERQTAEGIRIAQTDDDEDDRRDPPEPGFWIKVLEEVLHVLQNGIEDSTLVRFEDGLRQSIDRISERNSGMEVPVELLKNTPVGRSAKAMYDVLKHSAGWFRNMKPVTPPIPKQRTPSPKVTLESASPKVLPQARNSSKKITHLGG